MLVFLLLGPPLNHCNKRCPQEARKFWLVGGEPKETNQFSVGTPTRRTCVHDWSIRGQAASAKAGSLPAPWVEELKSLQDELPISNFQDARFARFWLCLVCCCVCFWEGGLFFVFGGGREGGEGEVGVGPWFRCPASHLIEANRMKLPACAA